MILKRLYIFLVLSALYSLAAFALPVSVKASLDSVNLQMGRMSSVHISLTQPKGLKGHFPIFSQLRENGIIPVCGDSVELRAPSRIDTVESGGRLNIEYDVPIQAFDSGYYRLPRFVFVAGNDSVASNELALKVYPVNATADTPIGDFASTADPADPSFFDFLPDWVIDFWWVILLLLLAIAVFIYGLRRYRREGSLLPRKPEPTPYEAALAGLKALKEQQLWQNGREKDYYTELTDILRRYLGGRFGINATEMTSRQILNAIGKNKEIADKRPYFRQILDMADFVKFAKVRPLPEDNILAYDNALRFVKETKPVEPAADQEQDNKREMTKGDGGTETAVSQEPAKKKGGEK